MSTTWSLTAQQICTDALEHLCVQSSGETPTPEDMNTALRGLDAVLKELPVYGYNWPKLSGESSLAWSAGQTVTLPADFYAYPTVWKSVDGKAVPLRQIPYAEWVKIADRSTATGEPAGFYIGPDKTLYFYPTPSTDPSATMQYQRIVDDASATVSPDVLQTWLYPLGYGVANEVALKFGIDQATRVEVAQRWAEKRERALQSSGESGAISITVDD